MSRTHSPRIHRAARVEDWVQGKRERRARRRGCIPMVLAFTGYGSTSSVRVLGRVILGKSKPQPESIRGWRSFVSVAVGFADVSVTIAGQTHTVRADRGGVVDAQIDVSLDPGWHTAQFTVDGGPTTDSQLCVVADGVTTGLVSDIDDTVMVTMLPRPMLAAWNTFVLDEHARIPTPGMAVLYERFLSANPGAPIVYLSTGAWNVAPTLRRFLSRNLFPTGPLLLTDWGPTHDRWFRSGREHKNENLRRLAEEFPNISWVLVGDDGQHDIDIYSQFAEQHPSKVTAIAIREMTSGEAVLAGGRAEHESLSDAPIVFAPDGAGLGIKLAELNILPKI